MNRLMTYNEYCCSIDGESVTYRCYGNNSSPVVLIVHGWWGSSLSRDAVAGELADFGFLVYVPDLPWFWKSTISKEYDTFLYARFLQLFVEEICPGPIILLWHSNGGRISIVVAAYSMISVTKLILVNSAGIVSPSIFVVVFGKVSGFLKSFCVYIPGFLFVRKLFYKVVGGHDYISLWEGFLKQTFVNVVHHDVREFLASIVVPTCLIWWEKDTYTPLVQGRLMHALLKDSVFIVCDGEKHGIHLHSPKLLVSHIVNFVHR